MTDNCMAFDFTKSLSKEESVPHIDNRTSPAVSLYYKDGSCYLKSLFITNFNGEDNLKTGYKKVKDCLDS